MQNNPVSSTMAPKKKGFNVHLKLSNELSDIVGMVEATRGACVKGLWDYIKVNGLQDPENKQYFFPDKKMAKIFGNDRMKGFSMSKFLTPHLSNIQ